ncbi:site-specific integrase [Paenibacillus arenosi]|uniref:site-specific integrase n=1 Tax=Paenibacillus arenosi TaxID=2774142 RepID=UPI003080B5EE
MYQKFINSLLENKYSRRTVEIAHSTMHNALEKAVTIGKLEKNLVEELFGDTKTFNSPRVIKISQSLINDLKDHMKYQNLNKLNMNDKYHHKLNLVKRADLPSIPIHGLRHTHAVIMLEAEVDMKYLQERLGHGSMQITSDVYLHISKKLEARNMDKYEDKLNALFIDSQKK